jgi:hypothetical protein
VLTDAALGGSQLTGRLTLDHPAKHFNHRLSSPSSFDPQRTSVRSSLLRQIRRSWHWYLALIVLKLHSFASHALALEQDWYVKRWKYAKLGVTIDEFADSVCGLLAIQLAK